MRGGCKPEPAGSDEVDASLLVDEIAAAMSIDIARSGPALEAFDWR
jgi:hypothetical protein